MTRKEYIDLYHATPVRIFYDEVFPLLINGEWTIDGEEWYPCVITDDMPTVPGRMTIITRNQTMAEEPICKVRKIEMQETKTKNVTERRADNG